MKSVRAADILRITGSNVTAVRDEVAIESPLALRLRRRVLAVLMRTPGHDRELAAGWLLSEGIITQPRQLLDLTACRTAEGDTLEIHLARDVHFEPRKHTRHTFTNSSCGVCSATTIAAALAGCAPLRDRTRTTPDLLRSLPERLAAAQPTFLRTGGLHACALFTTSGELLALREDVGRHNAMDKLLGWALLNDHFPLQKTIALLSGRASFEMLQKARAASIPIVAAISAPSSLAVEFAAQSGQTLLGFLRGQTMNLYTHPRRILTGTTKP